LDDSEGVDAYHEASYQKEKEDLEMIVEVDSDGEAWPIKNEETMKEEDKGFHKVLKILVDFKAKTSIQ